jgi:hypothetical protein
VDGTIPCSLNRSKRRTLVLAQRGVPWGFGAHRESGVLFGLFALELDPASEVLSARHRPWGPQAGGLSTTQELQVVFSLGVEYGERLLSEVTQA